MASLSRLFRTVRNPEYEQLEQETSKLHDFAVSGVARLEAEVERIGVEVRHLSRQLGYICEQQTQLHTLVTARLAAQIEYMSREIHGLKRRMYHPDAIVEEHAFNGQFSKLRIFADLCAAFPFDAFVETGSYLGWTTEYLCRQKKPVYSVEIDDAHYAQAAERLNNEQQVHLSRGESVEFLREVTTNALGRTELVFFYLDAHWREHLPLPEELAVIAAEHPRAVVMIDDFKVEDDPGYGYDSYEGGQEVTLAFLEEDLMRFGWRVYFPTLPSAEDHMTTDILLPRGTAVMACDPAIVETLGGIPSLRPWTAASP